MDDRTHRLLRTVTALLISATLGTVAAEGSPALACPSLVNWTDTDEVLGPLQQHDGATIEADSITATRDGVSELSGDVLIEQTGRRIEAASLTWNESLGELQAGQGITLTQDRLRVRADSGQYDVQEGSGSFEGAEFVVPGRGLRGTAGSVAVDEGSESRLVDVMITSCREGDEIWRLVSPDLTLDHQTGIGSGHHVRVELGRVPIFYAPYLSFPLDSRRKTGLLAPGFGSSSRRGTELTLPVYWNIARNLDATTTLRNMTARGLALEGEFRYLGQHSRGQIDFSYLPDDERLGIDREYYHWDHQLRAGDWRLDIDANRVGDSNYFVDLSNTLAGITPAHLRSNATLARRWGSWRFAAVVESWQTLDTSIAIPDRPYRRAPDLGLVGDHTLGDSGFDLLLSANLAWFDRSTGPVGARLDLTPGLRWNRQLGGVAVESILDLRYTTYQLDADSNPVNRSPSRAVPRFSLDGRMTFVRDTAGGRHQQTLEPRIMFLHVPLVDQSDLPSFDTAGYTLDPYTIFRRDRFVGRDRVGDTDQVTVALSHRNFDSVSGRERYGLTLGQVFYLSDRQVTVSGVPETEASSNLVAEFTMQPAPAWRFAATAEWDDRRGDLARGALSLRYNSNGRILNLRHRVLGATTEQSDASFSWPLSARLNAVGRLNYDHQQNRTIESFAGLEYRSCCWALRVVARSYLVPGTTQTDDSLLLQLVLEGLTSLGGGTEELLSRGILGYSSGD
jgi:LPS-assembly protein